MNQRRNLTFSILCFTGLLVLVMTGSVFSADESHSRKPVDYRKQIKPLLGLRCTGCHGPLRQNGGLRLDAALLIRKGGDSGTAVVFGKPEKSLLMDALLGRNGASQMPAEGKPLTEEEISLVREWIRQGAVAPENEKIASDPRQHWAFQKPQRPVVPRPRNSEWVRNPVDAFLAVAHEQKGLQAQPPAEKRVLLRRVYLDLIGLPPSPEELHTYLADDSPGAYEKVVDRLLRSKQYGERWGRHWMDVWRYSDWYGYRAELRNSARHIWRWRDWIVQSLNKDKPYNRMIVEMLAADEADPTNRDALRATGFLARNYYKFNRDVWMDDTIEHTSKAFLGITLNCARCHDHMYDPIAQREYYRFRAIFEPYRVRTDRIPGQPDIAKDGLAIAYDADPNVKTFIYERGNDKHPLKDNPVYPAVPEILNPDGVEINPVELPPTAYYPGLRPYIQNEYLQAARKKLQSTEKAVASAKQKLEAAQSRTKEKESASVSTSKIEDAQNLLDVKQKLRIAAKAQLESLKARIAADKARYATPPQENEKELARAASQSERRAALQTAEAESVELQYDLSLAERALAGGDKTKQKTVADLKQKLTAAKKKRETAQKTAAQQSDEYTLLTDLYPQTTTGRRLALARWIASSENPLTVRVAVNHIWMRHFGRPLVSSVFDFGINGKPPIHPQLLDWLADEFIKSGWSMKHLHRLIVTSNAYRMTSSVEVAGDENSRIDPDNVYLWRMNSRRMESEAVRDSVLSVTGQLDRTMGGPELDANLGQSTYRRSIYYRHAPEKFMTFLKLFDAPSTHECYRRNETVVPQQALALVNSPLSIEMSRKLAGTLNEQVGSEQSTKTDAAFIDSLFERVLCRQPTEKERKTCQEFLREQSRLLADKEKLTTFTGKEKLKVQASSDPHLRARESLVHVLLNHNEFVTIR